MNASCISNSLVVKATLKVSFERGAFLSKVGRAAKKDAGSVKLGRKGMMLFEMVSV